MARGTLQWNTWGGILEGNINSLLYHCIPSLFMAPHFPFTDRKCHQPFRRLIDRGY